MRFTRFICLSAPAFLALLTTPGNCGSEPIFRAPYFASNVGPTGLSQQAIVAGDFNRDGHRDLAVANGTETVSILIGRGDGTFLPNQEIAAGRFPSGVVTADLNRDGIEDLVLASQDSIHVLLGNGNGTFQNQTAYRAGRVPVCVAVADLNSDGMIDAVAGDWFNRGVVVLFGRGDGTLGPDVAWARDTAVWMLKAADVTGDGHPDLLTVDPFHAALTVLPVAPEGTIGPAQTYPVAAPSHTFDTGDVNGDGILDVAVECTDVRGESAVSLLLGQPGGSLAPYVLAATSIWPRSVSLGDLNADRHQDILITGGTFSQAEVLLGRGDATFALGQVFPTAVAPEAQILDDINKDGRLDLVANGDSHIVTVHMGNGDGTFGEVAPIGVGLADAEWVALGDINGDGRPDLASGGIYHRTIGIMPGRGDGTFGSGTVVQTEMSSTSGVLADVDRDGLTDLVLCGFSSIAIFPGNGAGSFGPKREYPVHYPMAVNLSDLNRDAKSDLVVVGDTLITVLLGTADGGFESAREYSIPEHVASGSIADFTGDGVPDLAVVRTGEAWGGDESVAVLRGVGDGTFEALGSFSSPGGAGIASGDFNRDGRVDLAISDRSDNPTVNVGVWIALGRGDGTFLAPRGFGFGGYYNSVVAADFNLDGNLDLALGQLRTVCVLAGRGDGTFQLEGNFGAAGFRGLAVGDVNLDGGPDIAAPVDVFQSDQGVYVLLNRRTRQALTARLFTGNGRVPIGTPGSKLCTAIEPLDPSFGADAIDRSTVTMSILGGDKAIRPMDSKGSTVGDADRNGVADVTACFSSQQLNELFLGFKGPRSVEVSIEGALFDGRRFHGSLTLTAIGTGRGERVSVHPNPLNPDGVLSFTTSEPGPLKVLVFDLQGRLVHVLLDVPVMAPGSHRVRVDGRDARGNALASGVYYYRIDTSGRRVNGRFTILK